MTRPPAHEVVEAAAWFAPPFALLLLALWVAIARRSVKRDRRYAAEQTRIDEQQRQERLATWRQSHPSQTSPSVHLGEPK